MPKDTQKQGQAATVIIPRQGVRHPSDPMSTSDKKERRHAPRVAGDPAVRLVLCDGPRGTVIAGPASGRLNDISSLGARIRIAKIFTDTCHLFYDPRDNPAHVLYLEFILAEDTDTNIPIPVQPVWFDRIEDEEIYPFAMGVKFLFSADDDELRRLIKKVREIHRADGSWLRNLLTRLWPNRSDEPGPEEK